jgi:hypothetical protein
MAAPLGQKTPLRFLLTSYEYPQFLRWLYDRSPGLADRSYDEQLRARIETGFLWGDFYSRNLRVLGHEATEVVPGNPCLQWAWAREHGLRLRRTRRWRLRYRRGWLPWLDRIEEPAWMLQVLAEQIRAFRPDVLFVRDIGTIPGRFLREMRPHVRLIVGQHASSLDSSMDYSSYDLMLSSLPNLVSHFASNGRRAELLRLGFESTVLDSIQARPRSIPVSFVGKLKDDHAGRASFLADLCRDVGVELWGPATNGLGAQVRKRYRGPAWGVDMFQVLRDSTIGLNHHETWAGPHANNLRLYEVTGVGTLLLTDWKKDLGDYFEPGSEVLAYRSVEECRELIEHYTHHDADREAIAAAGQRRTLREHTYRHRMLELLDILRKYV